MPDVQKVLASTAYALFALEQPIPLEQLGQGARAQGFPAAQVHTPEWFAAAAEGSSLLDMAPELRALPSDLEAADEVDLSGIDLIRVYAPEMQAAVQAQEEQKKKAEESAPAAPVPPPTPRTSTQIGLLKELDNLDD